jgi:hypothetical protein
VTLQDSTEEQRGDVPCDRGLVCRPCGIGAMAPSLRLEGEPPPDDGESIGAQNLLFSAYRMWCYACIGS